MDQRVQERNRLEKGLRGGARRSTERHIEWLGEEITLMDEEYRKALSESARLSETATLYQSVPGVGELTAASLVAYLPELGKCEGKALTALVGLAPWSNTGQRGYRHPRRPWCSASRAVPVGVARGDGTLLPLRERGKAGKVALVAVMRKLLLPLLNAIARRGTAFSNNPPAAALA